MRSSLPSRSTACTAWSYMSEYQRRPSCQRGPSPKWSPSISTLVSATARSSADGIRCRSVDIQGTCDAAFEPVRQAFADNFDQGLEVGASVCVTHEGARSSTCGRATPTSDGRPWEQDTIVNVWSTTKTMAAICVLMLADRGEVDLDAPVAHLLARVRGQRQGGGARPPRDEPQRRALRAWSRPIAPEDLYDCARPSRRCWPRQAPWWEPGTASGYHAVTQGFLQGEIVRRVTGRSIGTFFREEVAGPLGADFHIGLPESEDHRVADDLAPPPTCSPIADGRRPRLARGPHVRCSCPLTGTEPRTREWRAAEIPAAGGTGNARSVGRVHSALACGGEVDGVRLMSAGRGRANPRGADQRRRPRARHRRCASAWASA